jgi:hypothetical protein
MPMNMQRGKPQSPLALLAGRIANMAIPATANSIFSDIQKSHIRRFGQNFGAATDPRQFFMQSNAFSDQIKIGLGSTMSLQDAQNRIDRETRTELATRTGNRLPQFQAPLKTGIASPIQQQTAGGSSNFQQQSNNSMYVEDSRWPVTLAQILGSKMLSPDQLKRASIQNIANYMNVQGGTQTERAEAYYMFQRMMLEGFIRGVDITRDFKSAGAGGRNPKLNIVLTPGTTVASNANNIGLSTQAGTVKFNLSYMRKQPENVKMSLFYHEIGHELMNKEHSSAEGIMKSGGSNRAGQALVKSTASYNSIMNQLFQPNGSLSNGSKHLKVPVNRNQTANYDPSWFPSAQGTGGGYDPSTGGNSPDGGSQPNQTYIAAPDVTVSQTTINPFQPQEGPGNPGTIDTSSDGKPQTMNVAPVQAAPQGSPTGGGGNGFGAALSSVQQESGPSLQGMAGALNQLRAG